MRNLWLFGSERSWSAGTKAGRSHRELDVVFNREMGCLCACLAISMAVCKSKKELCLSFGEAVQPFIDFTPTTVH